MLSMHLTYSAFAMQASTYNQVAWRSKLLHTTKLPGEASFYIQPSCLEKQASTYKKLKMRSLASYLLENKDDGKKYTKIVKGKDGKERKVRYGAKGYRIAPGTKKGDSYCARSYGQMKMYPDSAKDPNSPLMLSRAKWKCKGKKSERD